MKKIYIASSWNNEVGVRILAKILREWGHEVYAFPESPNIFQWSRLAHNTDNGITCLRYESSCKAFLDDKAAMDWADTCILLTPSGRDSHLEAGYMKGQGKKLYIVGTFPLGEFSNMYHLADKLFEIKDFMQLKEVLSN